MAEPRALLRHSGVVCIGTTDRVGAQGYHTEEPFADYVYVQGTSAASPCAAGVAALILSVNHRLDAHDVEQIMRRSCVDLGPPGWHERFGWGFLNAFNALSLTPPP